VPLRGSEPHQAGEVEERGAQDLPGLPIGSVDQGSQESEVEVVEVVGLCEGVERLRYNLHESTPGRCGTRLGTLILHLITNLIALTTPPGLGRRCFFTGPG
jgi:hypothetical protein